MMCSTIYLVHWGGYIANWKLTYFWNMENVNKFAIVKHQRHYRS